MAAMVAAAAMADEPDVDLNIAELSGNAKVTWGVDLGSDAAGGGRTGFRNETDAKLKVNIANGGSKLTEGEGVWAELEVKVADALVAEQGEIKGGKAAIETAKLHIGDLYVGIKSGDAQVGGLNLTNAIKSDKYGVQAKGEKDITEGIVAGYDTDLFGVAVDFRSKPVGTADPKDYYTDQYAVAAEAELKDLAGFGAKAGVSYAFKSKTLGLFGSASYKLPLGDTTFVKASAGVGFNKVGDAKLGAGELGASVLFGWGDENDDSQAGGYYLDNDGTKKRTPGVGVAAYVPLFKHTYIDIVPAFYSGEIIENLTSAVLGEFIIPVDLGDTKPAFAFAGNVSYKLAVGDSITVTPQAGFRYANADYAAWSAEAAPLAKAADALTAKNTDNSGLTDNVFSADGLLNLKFGVEVGGLIDNTTFGAYYQSRNLVGGDDKAGTFNVFAKIAL